VYNSAVSRQKRVFAGSSSDDMYESKPLPSPCSRSGENMSVSGELVGTLLQSAIGRAAKTISTTSYDDVDSSEENSPSNEADDDDPSSFTTAKDVMDSSLGRAGRTIDESQTASMEYEDGEIVAANEQPQKATSQNTAKKKQKRSYLENPGVTSTALAHALWSATINPQQDTVIDATCGNGKDSLAMAKLLFPPNASSSYTAPSYTAPSHTAPSHTAPDDSDGPKPELICIDIQAHAISTTKALLLQELGTGLYHESITMVQSSHASLPQPRDESSVVGLICYNLGYLPGDANHKMVTTKLESTLASLTDAALMIRVGGMISCMTYPGSDLEEALSVQAFAEGLAMLTSKRVGGWESSLEDFDMNLLSSSNQNEDWDKRQHHIKESVREAIHKVQSEGYGKQTWRVFQHCPLGRPFSPILVTMTRIK